MALVSHLSEGVHYFLQTFLLMSLLKTASQHPESKCMLYLKKQSKNYVWHILSLQSIFCVWIILIRLSGNGLICFPFENQMINLLLTALVFLINVSIGPPPSLKRETTRLTQTEPVPKYLQLLPLLCLIFLYLKS